MKKTIWIFKGNPKKRAEFCRAILDELIPAIQKTSPTGLKVTLTRQKPPAVHVIPFSKIPVACISVYGEGNSISSLQQFPGCIGAYRVEEALPVSYSVTWPMGTPTPGVCLLTLFRKKKGLPKDVFLDRWHNGHTPMTLQLHPIWNYVRNVVLDARGATCHYDGIVEEHVRNRSDLLNPFRFFGPPRKTIWNMLVTLKDVRGFIDYPSIETWLADEIWYIPQHRQVTPEEGHSLLPHPLPGA